MMQIWFLFKIIETLIGTMCMIFHTVGFLDKEAIIHNMLYCGTFFGFTLFSFIGVLNIAVGGSPPALVECAINFCAAIMYISASVVSMRNAEKDFHLMYLSDFEEPLHPFFAHCRAQSIGALINGCVHLLHCILAFDVLFVQKRNSAIGTEDSSSSEEDSDEDPTSDETRPIRMYFLSRTVEKKLRKNQWFDEMCRRPPASLIIFSVMPPRIGSIAPSRRHSNIHDLEKAMSIDLIKQSTAKDRLNEKQDRETISSEEIKSKLDYDMFLNSKMSESDQSKQGKETKPRPILRKERKSDPETLDRDTRAPRARGSSADDIFALLRKKSVSAETISTVKESSATSAIEEKAKTSSQTSETQPQLRFQPEVTQRVTELRPKPVVKPEPIKKPETAIKPEPAKKTEPTVEPDTVIDVEPDTKPEIVDERGTTFGSRRFIRSRPILRPETIKETEESEPVVKPQPVIKSESDIQPETEVKTEPIVQAEPVIKPEPFIKPEPEVKAEPIVQPEPEVKAEPIIKTEPVIKSEPVIEPEHEVKTDPIIQIEPEVKTEPIVQQEPVIKPETEVKTDPTMPPEPLMKSELITEPERSIESQPIIKPEIEAQPEPISQPIAKAETPSQQEPPSQPEPQMESPKESESTQQLKRVKRPEYVINLDPATQRGSQTVVLQMTPEPRDGSPPRQITISAPPATSDMEPSNIPRLVKVKRNAPKSDSSTQTEDTDQVKRLPSGTDATVHERRRRRPPPTPEKRKVHTSAQTLPIDDSLENVASIDGTELPTTSAKAHLKPDLRSDLKTITEATPTEEDDDSKTSMSHGEKKRKPKPPSPPPF